MNAGDVALRPVEPPDRDFLLRVYASTRQAELALVPWSPEQKAAFVEQQFAAQDCHYHAEFPGAQYSVIVCQGCDAGRVYIERGKQVHMLDMTVLPEFRGRGIGAVVLQMLQQEARQRRCPLSVYVEVFNPSLLWFQKRGFRREEQNEPGIHMLMTWMPEAKPGSGAPL